VTYLFDSIVEEVAAGNKVQLVGFGSFEPRTRSARKGRNPRTGEEIDIPASTTVGFSAGKTFKDAVSGKA
jgi:DNA-binding protein HU-beta